RARAARARSSAAGRRGRAAAAGRRLHVPRGRARARRAPLGGDDAPRRRGGRSRAGGQPRISSRLLLAPPRPTLRRAGVRRGRGARLSFTRDDETRRDETRRDETMRRETRGPFTMLRNDHATTSPWLSSALLAGLWL